MKYIIAVFFLVISGDALMAQRFGGNPPSVKWQQVNNDAARVIYPKGLDSQALRVAAVAAALDAATLSTMGTKQKKIDIVLHPNTTTSNAYVALGPFRSEFYLTPSQNSFELGSLRWHDLLASHEYRHVQQYNNFNVGFSHVMRILFGQDGQELANVAAVPNWFWEGDAVYQETLVSRQGRGRLPFFFDDYRSLWLAGKNYSYMKLRNGSYRDFTPDHYRLGYMLVAYGREKYGEEFWRNVTHDAASYKGVFYPFQRAVKKYSQVSFKTFAANGMEYFRKQSDTLAAPVTSHKHFIGDQEFPSVNAGNALVYVETTYKKIHSFVIKTGSGSRKIRNLDFTLDNQFSLRNNLLVYSSYRPARRWAWNDYSEIQVLDLNTRHQTTISRKSKYFAPDISEDGNRVVAVEVKPATGTSLHILDVHNRLPVKVLPNADSLFYTYPKFIDSSRIVSAVRTKAGQMSIAVIRTGDGSVEYLTSPSYRVMGYPVAQRDTIYFTAADGAYDHGFAIVLSSGQLYRLDLRPAGIGVYQLAPAAEKLVFTSFTADGFRLQEIAKSEIRWAPVSVEEWQRPIPAFGVNFSGNALNLVNSVREQPLAAGKYAQTHRLFNFHSLVPYVSDPDYTLSIVGNNVLNTMSSELYFTYNRNEGYKQFGTTLTYGGLFPYINLGGNYIVDRRDYLSNNRPVYWNEGQLNAGLSVPLDLSKGRSLININAGADYVYKSVNYTGVYKDSFASTQLGYINGYVSFLHQIQQARQHIYPRFAQSLLLNYRNAVHDATAWQFLANGYFYFPGLALTHNFVVNLAWQQRDTVNQYRYSNGFPFSRGYEVPNLRTMFKWGANYHLPLFYPDWGFGNLLYFQRIRANVFYDYTRGIVAYSNGARIDTPFRSTGAELFFDTKWWNELPLAIGFRYSYLLDKDLFGGTGSNRFEFILPVNLFQR